MALETLPFDSDAAIAAYLGAVFEEGDADEMRDALRHVARARAWPSSLKRRASAAQPAAA